MIVLDLCSGLGGASAAMYERGWKVIRIDIDPTFNPDIIADVRRWSWQGIRPDLVWASPPCTEFSRESMPWSRTGQEPDLTIVNACKRIIGECNPRFWVIENVKGATKYLGTPRAIYGPFFLWGFFPDLGHIPMNWKKKESYGSSQRAERACIPYHLSAAVATAVERATTLDEVAV